MGAELLQMAKWEALPPQIGSSTIGDFGPWALKTAVWRVAPHLGYLCFTGFHNTHWPGFSTSLIPLMSPRDSFHTFSNRQFLEAHSLSTYFVRKVLNIGKISFYNDYPLAFVLPSFHLLVFTYLYMVIMCYHSKMIHNRCLKMVLKNLFLSWLSSGGPPGWHCSS